jgi:outer membrane protein
MTAHKTFMKRVAILSCLVFLGGALTGCMSREGIVKDLTQSREAAFREWVKQREGNAASGEVVKGPLTLENAVALSLVRNRGLQAVLEEKNVAQGRILEAYGGVLPHVSVGGTYTRKDRDEKKIEGTVIDLGPKDAYETALTVTQPLFRGGASTAALRASRLYETLTDESVREAVQSTLYAVMMAYRRAQLAKEQMEVTKTFVALAEAHLGDVEIKRQFGTASDFNVLRSKVELSNARAEMIYYQNNYHEVLTLLFQTMGVSQESAIELTDVLAYEPFTLDEEEAVHRAFLGRPDLSVAELTVKLQEESLNVALSDYWPQVNAFYNHKLSKPDPYIETYNEWDDAWFAGIDVTIPLFDGLMREGRVAQERARLKKQNINLLDVRERALYEVKNALLSLRDAKESVEVQKLTLEQAHEGLRLAEVGYREGVLDQVSVLDAQAALMKAELLHFKSLFDHAAARIDLEKAMGMLTGPVTQTTAGE